jgi:hypothetical protein
MGEGVAMSFIPWDCAMGEAAPVFMPVADEVALSPADDSVDSNSIIIEGAGTISSFGASPHKVMKRIMFIPLVLRAAPGSPAITLVNSAHLNLLGKADRSLSDTSYGFYKCNGADHWDEIYFVQRGDPTIRELEARIKILEEKNA